MDPAGDQVASWNLVGVYPVKWSGPTLDADGKMTTNPHQARAGVELGRLLYEKTGQWERAAAVYRQALSIDSHCVAAEEGLARVRSV